MRVAVICECSGVVRDAFIRAGHVAVSFDLAPSDSPLGKHVQRDARECDFSSFDLAICHPPCTRLAVSGALHFSKYPVEQEAALNFVKYLLQLPVPRIALENPVSIISSRIRKPDQIIQPYWFGHAESKKTCLWLTNLPPLYPTRVVSLPASGHWNNQTPSGQNRLGPSPQRAKIRSTTYQGIADAMAIQWGNLNA